MTSMSEKLTNAEVDEMAHSGKDVDVTRVRSCKAACETCVKDNMVIEAGEINVAGENHYETVMRGISEVPYSLTTRAT